MDLGISGETRQSILDLAMHPHGRLRISLHLFPGRISESVSKTFTNHESSFSQLCLRLTLMTVRQSTGSERGLNHRAWHRAASDHEMFRRSSHSEQ